MKKRTAVILSVLLCVAVCLSVITTVTSAATAIGSSSNNYENGLGTTRIDSVAYTENGVQKKDQAKLEVVEGADGGRYAVFSPNYEGKNPAHSFVTVKYDPVYFVNTSADSEKVKYLLFEMDFTTESEYINGIAVHFVGKKNGSSAGYITLMQIVNENGKQYLKTPNQKVELPAYRGVWSRISFLVTMSDDNTVASARDARANIYLNGALVDSNVGVITSDANEISEVRINQFNNVTVSKTNTFCFDNVSAKTYGKNDELANLVASGSDLLGFSDGTYTADYDFPSVRALFDVDGKKYGSVPELTAALKGGEIVTVLRDVPDTVSFTKALTLKNPNGYKINYTADGLTEIKDGTTINFYSEFTEMTVKWHIGNEVVEEVYTSLAKATFKGTYPETTVIDGVTYCAVGFSNREGGAVLSDLGYVSESNREFWLVYSAPVASRTAGGNVEYAYTTSEVENWIKTSTAGQYILLYSDITLSSYDYNSKIAFTLDLGGHTLTQASNAPNHIFILQGADSNITVKNGTVNSVKNIVFHQQDRAGIVTTLEDLAINAATTIADVRAGTLNIIGCTSTISGNFITAFGGIDNSNGPTVVIKNSDIEASAAIVSSSTKDASTRNSATIVIENSELKAATVVGATNINIINIDGGVLECTTLIAPGANGTTLSIGNGTELHYKNLSTDDTLVTLNVPQGTALARRGDRYVVTDDFVTVSWDVGTDFASEKWVKGEIPVCPFELPEANATVKYTFPEITAATEDVTYTLTAVPSFTPMMNLSLSLDFDLGIYLPAEADVISITIGGVTYTYEQPLYVTVGGIAYKKYTFRGITPERACDYVSLELVLSGGDFSIEADYEVSLVNYLGTILAGGYSREAELLAAAVANYVDKAYIYAEKTSDIAYRELSALRSLYNLDMADRTPEGEGFDMTAVNGAIDSARLVLDSELAFRFELDREYTGRVKISYFYEGERTEKEIYVINGTYLGKTYIDVTLDAADLAEYIGFSISDGMGGFCEGRYSLYTYYTAMKGESDTLDSLVRALYSYSVAAKNYKSTKA